MAHEVPLIGYHPNYKFSQYNVMVEWDIVETNKYPLSITIADNTFTCALYSDDKNLLH